MALATTIRKRCEYCHDFDPATAHCALIGRSVAWYEVCEHWQYHRVAGYLTERNKMRGAIARGKGRANENNR